jgi:hypothetical protein
MKSKQSCLLGDIVMASLRLCFPIISSGKSVGLSRRGARLFVSFVIRLPSVVPSLRRLVKLTRALRFLIAASEQREIRDASGSLRSSEERRGATASRVWHRLAFEREAGGGIALARLADAG